MIYREFFYLLYIYIYIYIWAMALFKNYLKQSNIIYLFYCSLPSTPLRYVIAFALDSTVQYSRAIICSHKPLVLYPSPCSVNNPPLSSSSNKPSSIASLATRGVNDTAFKLHPQGQLDKNHYLVLLFLKGRSKKNVHQFQFQLLYHDHYLIHDKAQYQGHYHKVFHGYYFKFYQGILLLIHQLYFLFGKKIHFSLQGLKSKDTKSALVVEWIFFSSSL
jgi:hypothetical protein